MDGDGTMVKPGSLFDKIKTVLPLLKVAQHFFELNFDLVPGQTDVQVDPASRARVRPDSAEHFSVQFENPRQIKRCLPGTRPC